MEVACTSKPIRIDGPAIPAVEFRLRRFFQLILRVGRHAHHRIEKARLGPPGQHRCKGRLADAVSRADGRAKRFVARRGIREPGADPRQLLALPFARPGDAGEFALAPREAIHHRAQRIVPKPSQAIRQLLVWILRRARGAQKHFHTMPLLKARAVFELPPTQVCPSTATAVESLTD